jgi:tol-pal system protein YbgF
LRRLATTVLLVASLVALEAQPVLAQKKDTLLLMRQLDTMQQMIMNMQKTLDSQTAVLKTLIEQANDNVNSMKAQVDELRKATQQNLASSNARMDSMTRDIQALSESLEEAKARLAKLSDQVTQTQNIIQTLNTAPAAGTAGAAGANPAPVPDADTLYKSGLSSFNGGQYQLAIQSFQEYLQYYGDTDLASNAQFYIGECYYSQGDFQKAVDEYNKCIEQYPKGNKIAPAQLKKGYALLALDQQRAGISELRSLIRRFPSAREADLARQRLKKLGVR